MKWYGMKRYCLLGIGGISLFLGGIGILIPVWPTTPFVVLAAGCFAGSSQRMYERLVRSKYFGEFIKNYREHTGVSYQSKRNAILYLWIMLVLSAVIIRNAWMYLVLGLVGIVVTLHIILLRNKVVKNIEREVNKQEETKQEETEGTK